METGIGTKRQGDVQQSGGCSGAEHPQADALERQLDGLQLRSQLGHHRTRRSPPARSACSSAAPTSTPTWCRPTTSIRRSTAWRRSRLANSKNAGVLGGGTLAAVSPKSNPAQIAAAMKWISFYYMDKLVDSQGGDPATPRRLSRTSSRSACRSCRSSTRRSTQKDQKWIKPYINVPESQFAPFNNGIFKENVIPEPESATQAIYGDLDAVGSGGVHQPGRRPVQPAFGRPTAAGQTSIRRERRLGSCPSPRTPQRRRWSC